MHYVLILFLDTDYGAPLQTEDFEGDASKAIGDINAWVSAQTEGKIPEPVSPASVNSDTRLMLVNAIYFKGSWRTRFDPADTQAEQFLANDATATSVQTMSALVPDAGYAAGPGFAVAELPYTGNDLAMDIVLPSGDGGLAALEAQLDGGAVLAALGSLRVANLQMALPKFQISQTIDLIPVLEGLGIEHARQRLRFPASTARATSPSRRLSTRRWSRWTRPAAPRPPRPRWAWTAIGIEPTSIPFTVDHPFLFFIRDLPTCRPSCSPGTSRIPACSRHLRPTTPRTESRSARLS